MAHVIVIQPPARADIRRIVAHRTQHGSANSAAVWHDRLLRAIRTLQDNPERCPLADEAADLGIELRYLLHGRRRSIYRVLFTITDNTVDVLRVRHAAQDALTSDDI